MTDRNPDDLYDALRDRLADYGQEPPAALWAGILAQLPPPVVAPQLRRRRRRVPVAWLFLITLSMVAVGAAWHWWPAQPATTILRDRQPASRITLPNATRTRAASPPSAAVAGSAHPSAGAMDQPPASQVSSATAQRPAHDAAAGPVGAPVTASSASKELVAADDSRTAASPAVVDALAPAGAAAATSTKAVVVSSAAQAASGDVSGLQGGSAALPDTKDLATNGGCRKNTTIRGARGQAQGLSSQTRTVANANQQGSETATLAEVRPGKTRPSRAAATAATSRASQTLVASRKPLPRHRRQCTTALVAVTKPVAGQPLRLPSTPSTTETPTTQPNPTKARASSAQLLANRPGHLASGMAQATLPGRPVVAVRLARWPGLAAPQPVAVGLSPRPVPFASRWAVQVVAGPALTYRYLDTSAGAAAPTSPPFVYTPGFTPVATLERPALGSAAQVTVRRTLNGHWSLSAGLGYAEYASALALQQVHAAAIRTVTNGSDSAATTSIHGRDTYRFATVPVRVGYGWTLSGRWRVGLLAGAEAAVYVGGNSTEGSAYRRVSLGASLGAEARYRLGGGRWELLAQPTATYLLSPLANYTPYYQRHLFGGAALLGVAFNLP